MKIDIFDIMLGFCGSFLAVAALNAGETITGVVLAVASVCVFFRQAYANAYITEPKQKTRHIISEGEVKVAFNFPNENGQISSHVFHIPSFELNSPPTENEIRRRIESIICEWVLTQIEVKYKWSEENECGKENDKSTNGISP